MTPEIALLLAELRVGRPSALRQLADALDAANGSVRAAAATLGLGERTVHRLREQSPAVAEVLDRHGMGRAGAANVATSQRESGRRKKKSRNRHLPPCDSLPE